MLSLKEYYSIVQYGRAGYTVARAPNYSVWTVQGANE